MINTLINFADANSGLCLIVAAAIVLGSMVWSVVGYGPKSDTRK